MTGSPVIYHWRCNHDWVCSTAFFYLKLCACRMMTTEHKIKLNVYCQLEAIRVGEAKRTEDVV